jgi:EmrB/QacA subfamily drug resistance transporter
MESRSPRRWWALLVLAAAQFMVIMDTSIIGVALPDMQADLGFSQDNLSWVFNAYVIAFGGLLLLGGRLSDLLGPRRVFAAGWVVLIAGSALAGLADSTSVEITARAIQGAGSALIAPSALTLLMMLFAGEPRELGKAMAVYGAAAPAGGTAGVFLGGVLTEWADWPWVFFVNIPVGLAVLLAVPALLPRTTGQRGSIDITGALAVTGGLALTVLGIVRAPQEGWTSPETLVSLVAGAVLIATFVISQRLRRTPLMPLGIWRRPNLAAANVSMALLGAAWIPMWFFLNLYLQQVLGYGAFESGAALLPMTVTIMLLMVGVTGRLMARYSLKSLIATGIALLAAGLTWLSFVPEDGSFATDVLPGSLVAAVGMSLAFVPAMMSAIVAARPEEGGLASGIVNTTYQVGSALGLAVMTAVASSQGADQLGDTDALTDGFQAAFLGAAGVAVAAVILTLALLRRPRPAPTPEAAASEEAEELVTV